MKNVGKMYLSLLLKTAVAFLVFTTCRILFYAFNHSYFPNIEFINLIGGVRFDWMAITILYLPFYFAHLVLYKGKSIFLKILFHLSNTIAIILSCLDLEYYKFTFKRTTADLFQTSGIENDILNLLPTFLTDYWYVVLIAIILFLISIKLYRKTEKLDIKWPGFFHYLLFLLPAFGLITLGNRGGYQYKPLGVINAGQYADAPNIPLVLNTPFTVIKSIGEKEITPLNYFPEAELASVYTPIQSIEGDSNSRKMNVVLIIAESFSKEYIGGLNDGDGYTPYLDQLMDSSFVLEETYANGKKSIEGLPAILSGIPTLMNTSYISSKYSSNKINSLGNFLKKEDYETVFYHGGENGTMGFNAFTSIAGIDEYIGRDQYPYEGDYDGNWGIFDEPFLQFCIEDLNKRNQPFFASIFTLSSHHPYTIPEKYIGKFREGPLPILESVGYADYSIHQFFEVAKKQDWFNNTLFVITADHTSQSYRPIYNNRVGMYAIPLIFYAPGKIRPQRSQKVSQQSDIFPSVIDFLNYNSKIVSFGQSVFDSTETSFSVSYINGTYQLIDGDFCLHFNGEKTVRFYNRIEDPNLKSNLVGKNPPQLKPLEKKLKAILQQYNNRILTNQLTVE
ncbi:MAG: sulfatase-like hydrolase/transferase [Vicingaceae bacterium]